MHWSAIAAAVIAFIRVGVEVLGTHNENPKIMVGDAGSQDQI